MPTKTIADDPYASLPDAGDPYAEMPVTASSSRPEETHRPEGGSARRFLTSAYSALVGPLAGMYHGIVEGPQNAEEAHVAERGPWGPIYLREKRFLIDPMKSEAHKTAEEFRQADPWNLHPSQEAIWHRERALGHGLATVLPFVGPAAAQAGQQAGTQYASGDVAGAIGTGVGAVIPYLIPEGAGKLAKSEFVSRTIPKGQITRLIRPMQGDLKFGKDPAAAILDERLTANTLEALGNKVSDRLQSVGKQLDAEARKPVNARKTVDLSASLKPLNDAMSEAAKGGDRSLFAKLQEIKTELTYNWKPFRTAQGEVVLRPTGLRNLKMNPAEALEFKRQLGDRVRWSEDPLTGEANKALGAVYGQIKDSVNAAVPGLKELNERFSNLVGAAKSIQRRLPVEMRNAHWSLSDIVIGTHSIPLAITRHIARTPAVRTRTAAGLYNLPRIVPEWPTATATRAPVIGPTAVAAPVVGAAQGAESSRERLRQLQAEAAPKNPAKQWGHTYTNADGRDIVSDDLHNWFFRDTGEPYQGEYE